MIRRHLVGLMVPVLVTLIFCGLGTAALAEELDIAKGAIHITETGYSQGESLQIEHTGPYTVTGTGSEPIVIESGTHDITVSNLQITASKTPAIQVDAGATLRLTVVGENRLTGGSGIAGICVVPAYDSEWNYDADASGKLYLSGDGTLGAVGGDGDAAYGTYGGGAGIGGGAICDGGRIQISGGSISATAGPCEDSMGAAGIGGGNDSSVREVSITGGTVTARASGGAAGIGGGTNTSYSPVHYGDVDGQVSPDRTGIISISGDGASVYAYGGTGQGFSGGYGGAGIGSGYPTANQDRSVAFHISITNGASVRAFGGYHAQAIGYGYRPTDYTGYGITLELDDSIFLWAQNADYYQPALAAATKYDAAPIGYSSASRYLTAYTDADKNASAPASHQAPGYLGQPSAGADGTFDWSFDSTANTVSVGPVTVIDQVSGLNGNWATLCELKPVVISLADIIIYVGGAGYESVVTDVGGNVVNTVSDGLPESPVSSSSCLWRLTKPSRRRPARRWMSRSIFRAISALPIPMPRARQGHGRWSAMTRKRETPAWSMDGISTASCRQRDRTPSGSSLPMRMDR